MSGMSYELVKDFPQWLTAQSGEEMSFNLPQPGLRVYGIVTGETGANIVSSVDGGVSKTEKMTAPTSIVLEVSVTNTYKVRVDLPGGGQWKIVITAVEVPAECSSLSLLYDNSEGSYSSSSTGCASTMCALLLSPSESTKISTRLESQADLMAMLVAPGSQGSPSPVTGRTIDLPTVTPGSMLAVLPGTGSTQTTLSLSLKYTTDDASCFLGGGVLDWSWNNGCSVNSRLDVKCQSSTTDSEDDKKLPLGAIIGGVVGGIVVIAIVVGVVVFFVMKSNKPSVPENTPETV